MSTQHTPGPWNPYFDETYGVLGPDKGRVAICMNLKGSHGLAGRRHGNEVAANARLIAASPDLLEALKMGYADTMDYIQRNHLSGSENNHWLVLARAAIAKATGE
jgi:hypothetical protein